MRTKIIPPIIPVTIRCVECHSYLIRRVKNRIGSGAYQVFDLCLDCGKNARGSALYIPHKQAGILLEDIPLFLDYTSNNPPCCVCGSRNGTELHHFAPVHIFGSQEAERWPKDYLCKGCHDQWHITIAMHCKDDCLYCKGLITKGQRNGQQ